MLKSQDILVLLKLLTSHPRPWTYKQLAELLYMSQSEVHAALQRSNASGLYSDESRLIRIPFLLEFLIHGLKYVFPTQPGALVRGLPTAHSAEPLNALLAVQSDDIYVWPDENGLVRGQAIEPLYRTVPLAAKADSELYALLSLLDAIRVGRVRDRNIAIVELKKRLLVNDPSHSAA